MLLCCVVRCRCWCECGLCHIVSVECEPPHDLDPAVLADISRHNLRFVVCCCRVLFSLLPHATSKTAELHINKLQLSLEQQGRFCQLLQQQHDQMRIQQAQQAQRMGPQMVNQQAISPMAPGTSYLQPVDPGGPSPSPFSASNAGNHALHSSSGPSHQRQTSRQQRHHNGHGHLAAENGSAPTAAARRATQRQYVPPGGCEIEKSCSVAHGPKGGGCVLSTKRPRYHALRSRCSVRTSPLDSSETMD